MIISVVIPTRHRNNSLAKCLDCLAPGTQILPATEYEVIVTDDGSIETAEIMVRGQYSWARWVKGPSKGPAANRNSGVEHARGRWLAFTDDDCLPEPQWLHAFARHIEKTPDVLEGKTTTELGKALFQIAPKNLQGGYLWSCNMMIHQSVFRELKGFDERIPYPHLEDVDFYWRLQKAGYSAQFVPEAVVFHPLRPLAPIFQQSLAHESDWYMSRKHKVPLSQFGMHPYLYWKSQLRQIVKNSRSPLEALRFFLVRSCVEASVLSVLWLRWNRKYKM